MDAGDGRDGRDVTVSNLVPPSPSVPPLNHDGAASQVRLPPIPTEIAPADQEQVHCHLKQTETACKSIRFSVFR